MTPWFTDEELDGMCEGLKASSSAARIRYLQRLGLKVDRKPNGKPLAWRPMAAPEPAQNASSHNLVGMEQWYAARRARRGQKSQGR